MRTIYIHVSIIFFGSSQSDQQILVFRHHGGLQLTMPVLADGQKLQTTQYPTLFCTLLQSVLQIFQGEQYRLRDSGQEAVPQLIDEFINYAYNKEPFRSHLWSRETKPLKWWEQVSKDSNARLLSVHQCIFLNLHLKLIHLFYDTENRYQNIFNLPVRDL